MYIYIYIYTYIHIYVRRLALQAVQLLSRLCRRRKDFLEAIPGHVKAISSLTIIKQITRKQLEVQNNNGFHPSDKICFNKFKGKFE